MIIGIVGHFGRFWVHWGLLVRPVQGGSPCIVYALGLAYVQEEKSSLAKKTRPAHHPPGPVEFIFQDALFAYSESRSTVGRSWVD